MIEPSKKLLSCIFNNNVTFLVLEDTEIWYKTECGIDANISIYELMHKIKQWAFSEGYAMKVDIIGKADWCIEIEYMHDGNNCYAKCFYNKNEFEAVVIAAEYILNKDNK